MATANFFFSKSIINSLYCTIYKMFNCVYYIMNSTKRCHSQSVDKRPNGVSLPSQFPHTEEIPDPLHHQVPLHPRLVGPTEFV